MTRLHDSNVISLGDTTRPFNSHDLEGFHDLAYRLLMRLRFDLLTCKTPQTPQYLNSLAALQAICKLANAGEVQTSLNPEEVEPFKRFLMMDITDLHAFTSEVVQLAESKRGNRNA